MENRTECCQILRKGRQVVRLNKIGRAEEGHIELYSFTGAASLGIARMGACGFPWSYLKDFPHEENPVTNGALQSAIT